MLRVYSFRRSGGQPLSMIVSSDGDFTFMYRVGGIAVHEGCLLVERNVTRGYHFVPGGRVEYGESAAEALAREVYEELGEEVQIGRLLLVTDNFFEQDGQRYQEAALYFLMTFAPDSKTLRRSGTFQGTEPGTVFQWLPVEELERAILFPELLPERVRSLPRTPEYIVQR